MFNSKIEAIFLLITTLKIFGYLALHEYLSIRWNSKYEPLRWLAAMTVVAGGIYYFGSRLGVS